MSIVTIAHARGGGPTTPGDQTGKEVTRGVWYSGGWTVLLRPKSALTAEKLASFAEAAADNDNIGYAQGDRNSLRKQAQAVNFYPAAIQTPCNCDCSAFASVCAEAAGVNVPYVKVADGVFNAPTTWTIRGALASTGEFEVLTDSKYLTSPDYLKRGDILVNEPQATGHAVVVTSNGGKAAQTPAETAGPSGTATQTNAANPAESTGDVKTKKYIVQWGDTLWGLAQRFGTTVEALAELNGIENPHVIIAGMPLEIPDAGK